MVGTMRHDTNCLHCVEFLSPVSYYCHGHNRGLENHHVLDEVENDGKCKSPEASFLLPESRQNTTQDGIGSLLGGQKSLSTPRYAHPDFAKNEDQKAGSVTMNEVEGTQPHCLANLLRCTWIKCEVPNPLAQSGEKFHWVSRLVFRCLA